MPAPTSSRAEDLLVVQTYVVQPKDRPLHYEIHLAPDAEARPTVLVTRDVALYEQAVAIEGSSQRVTARWNWGQNAAGRRCQVLQALRATNGGSL